jgi:hypothetical protein
MPRLPTLYLDNTSAESLTKEQKFHLKAKYIDIRHFYIREDIVIAKKLVVKHILSRDNIADISTKALDLEPFERYKRYISLLRNHKATKGLRRKNRD